MLILNIFHIVILLFVFTAAPTGASPAAVVASVVAIVLLLLGCVPVIVIAVVLYR